MSDWIKLSGTINKLTAKTAEANFFINDDAVEHLQIAAVASAVAGLGAQAVALASYSTSMEEEAVYLTFELDGRPCKGWIWRDPPFKNGDQVDIACQWQETHYEVYAIARPKDKMIALYPHCTRGTKSHNLTALKWWGYLMLFSIVFFSFIGFLLGDPLKQIYPLLVVWLLGSGAFFGLMVFNISGKFIIFSKVSEQCFKVLGLHNPSQLNLTKVSKKYRTPNSPMFFSHCFFKYE